MSPRSRSIAQVMGCLSLVVITAVSRADTPPADPAGASLPQDSILSSLKQSFGQDPDREVVRGHFELGSAPNVRRYYCLVDSKTGNRRPNGVLGDPVTRKDGMTGIKNGYVSLFRCADAEKQNLLITSGYLLSGKAANAPPVAAAPVVAAAAIPTSSPTPATAPAPAVAPPTSEASDRKVLADLDTEYQNAVKNNDAKTMSRILADDYVLVDGNGKRWTKADLLTSAENGKTHYEQQRDTEQTVRIWGDTAVVTAKLWVKGVEDGAAVNYTVWFSDTYTRTPGGWRYVFGQASLPQAR